MSNFLSDDKFNNILNCFIADCGIRETAIIVGVSKNTVKKIWREFWSYGGKPKERRGGYWEHYWEQKKRRY